MPQLQRVTPTSQPTPRYVATSFFTRLVRRVWRKQDASNDGGAPCSSPSDPLVTTTGQHGLHLDLHPHNSSGSADNSRTVLSALVTTNRSDDDSVEEADTVDTEPLIESHP